MTEPIAAPIPISDQRGYLDYYGLTAIPFRSTVEPRRLWLGRAHREILATLAAAVRHGHGVLLLTGEVGTGKTSLVAALIEELSRESVLVGRISIPVFDTTELFQAVAEAFGIRTGVVRDKLALASHLEGLLGRGPAGRRALLVIDEAQALDEEILRAVCDLSTVTMPSGSSLTTLLVGHAELASTLARDDARMPWPVVSTRCVLGRLTPQEVGEYIESRLRMAGGDRSMFDRDAIQHVAEISRGALGVVNVVCEHALLAGSRKRARLIGRDLIDDCLAERGLSHTDGPGEASDSPRGDRAAVGRGEPGARKGDESERLIRRTRARWVAALGGAGLLVALAVAGGYALRATRTGRMSPQAAPAPARDLTSAPQINPPAAAVEGPTAPIEAPSPVAPPAITSEPTAPAGEGRREVRRPAAGIPRPPRVEDTRPPNPPARRDQPGSRAAEGRSESPDPGAVIDWLLERSSKP